jgi:hypothetical protein
VLVTNRFRDFQTGGGPLWSGRGTKAPSAVPPKSNSCKSALNILSRTAHPTGAEQPRDAQNAAAIEFVKLVAGKNRTAGHQRLLDEDAPRQISHPDLWSGRSIYRGGTAAHREAR